MKITIKKESQKGFSPLIIVLGIAVLIVVGVLISKSVKPSSEKAAAPSPSPTPTVSVVPKITSTATPTKSASQTPTPTVAAIPPYQLEARLVCARPDATYKEGNHVDLVYQVTVNGSDIPFGTLTLTDNKTKEVFDLADGGHSGPPGNFINISSATGYTFHWMLQDSNYKQMPFIADGREYTLKLYKLTTASEFLPKDLQPLAEKTFSKVCEF